MTRQEHLKALAAAHRDLAATWNRWFAACDVARAGGIEVSNKGGLSITLPPDMPQDDHGFSKRAAAYFKSKAG